MLNNTQKSQNRYITKKTLYSPTNKRVNLLYNMLVNTKKCYITKKKSYIHLPKNGSDHYITCYIGGYIAWHIGYVMYYIAQKLLYNVLYNDVLLFNSFFI